MVPWMEIGPGAVHLPHYLPIDHSARCSAPVARSSTDPLPAYVPTVRGGGKMHVRMLCLGRHWNGKTYTYEATRSDFDGLPAPPLPDEFSALARELARAAGMAIEPTSASSTTTRPTAAWGCTRTRTKSERVARGRGAGRVGLARRYGAVPVRRTGGAIRSRR